MSSAGALTATKWCVTPDSGIVYVPREIGAALIPVDSHVMYVYCTTVVVYMPPDSGTV